MLALWNWFGLLLFAEILLVSAASHWWKNNLHWKISSQHVVLPSLPTVTLTDQLRLPYAHNFLIMQSALCINCDLCTCNGKCLPFFKLSITLLLLLTTLYVVDRPVFQLDSLPRGDVSTAMAVSHWSRSHTWLMFDSFLDYISISALDFLDFQQGHSGRVRCDECAGCYP